MTTLNIGPTPAYVRAALAHSEIPLTYNDDGTVSIPAGPGFDSNGNMTIPEGHVLREILSATVNLAMLKHVTDTMVLPSNANGVREVATSLRGMVGGLLSEDGREFVTEQIERLEGIAGNLEGLVADSGAPAPAEDIDDLRSEVEVLRQDFEAVEENLRERIREVERALPSDDDISRMQDRIEEIDGKVEDLERDLLELNPDGEESE